MVVDPGQFDMGAASLEKLGPLAAQTEDPAADPQFDVLLENPQTRAMLAPRMTTHGVTKVREYIHDLTRYNSAETIGQVSCPSFVTDNEADPVSTGQGKLLFEHLECPKEFRLFKKEEGAEGHCEGMAPVVF
jgi:hypothetical protein